MSALTMEQRRQDFEAICAALAAERGLWQEEEA